MTGDESDIGPSGSTVEQILDWQLSTYHHIHELAQGVLSSFLSVLAIVATLATIGFRLIPLPANSPEAYQNAREALIYPVSLSNQSAILINTSNMLVVVSFLSAIGAVITVIVMSLFGLVFEERLNIETTNPRLGVRTEFSDWARDNKKQIQRLQRRFKQSARYVPRFFALGAYLVAHYLLVVDVSLNFLLPLNLLSTIFVVGILYRNYRAEDGDKILFPEIPDASRSVRIAQSAAYSSFISVGVYSLLSVLIVLLSIFGIR